MAPSIGCEVYVVDDEPAVLDALTVALSHNGYHVTGFADGAAFLPLAKRQVPACILLDIHMPGCSGIDILKELDAPHYPAPVFIISGVGDIPTAVDAIRNGAFDFIEKPFAPDAVVVRVREAVETYCRLSQKQGSVSGLPADFAGEDQLTRREREVLAQITGGASNKEAGRRLVISPRTVEVHRARIMEKLGAKNAADLVRIVLTHAR